MEAAGSPSATRNRGPLSLLLLSPRLLFRDFGDAMPVVFEVAVDHRRLRGWTRAVRALAPEVFRSFSPPSSAPSHLSVRVEGVDGLFRAVEDVDATERVFSDSWDPLPEGVRLGPPGLLGSSLDLAVDRLSLELDSRGLRWEGRFADVEARATVETPRLGTFDVLMLRLLLAPTSDHESLFREMIAHAPRKASVLLYRGLPDPAAHDPSVARASLVSLPLPVLRPLLEHQDPGIRARAARAVNGHDSCSQQTSIYD